MTQALAPVIDAQMRMYYDLRAAEYDEWWTGTGRYAASERVGWHDEVAAIVALLDALPAARSIDVACGTGYLSRHLPGGDLTLLDQSPTMLDIAARRAPHATVVCGEAVPLPFADQSFERLFTANFYSHLLPHECQTFRREARRVAARVVVLDAALRPGQASEQWQVRKLNDGTRHRVFKRYFSGSSLAEEWGGGSVLHAGHWFVVVEA